MKLEFAKGIPPLVRHWMKDTLSDEDQDPRLRDAVKRLAADDAWLNKLPASSDLLPSFSFEILAVAVFQMSVVAFAAALDLKPLPPRTPPKLVEFLHRHRPTRFLMIATQARMLLKDLSQLPSVTRALFSQEFALWNARSDREITFESVTSTIEALATCSEALDSKQHELDELFKLRDPPKKRGDKHAQRTYFVLIMSDFLGRLYGRPCDAVVAELVDPMFDLKGAMSEESVRGLRRKR